MKTKGKSGFTLVEILIATGLLSLLVISVFNVFSSSTNSFNDGSWRLENQRKAQLFLLKLREVLEKANHAYAFDSNGNFNCTKKPIYINKRYYNNPLVAINNGIIICGAIVTPFYASNPALCIEESNGIWKGFSLQCENSNTLKLYLTGNWDSMNPTLPADVGQNGDTKFVLRNTEGDFSLNIDNIDSFSVSVQAATGTVELNRPEVIINCRIKLVKPQSRGRVSVEEQITAKIIDRKLEEVISRSF